MRVALVSMQTSHLEDTEGARRFERLARLLSEHGHDVTVFCSQWWEGYEDTHELDGITYYGVTLGPAVTSFCARLPFILARYGPDVIHARPNPPHQVLAARSGGTLARAPMAVEWFGDEELPGDSRWTRWAVTKPNIVVTPSEVVRTEVREWGPDGDDVWTIPESIDFAAIEDTEPAEETDVAFAHPLTESANLGSLLLGLAELRTKDWSATVIGDGPDRARYESQAADLRIDDRIEFVGACDRERRIAIYRGAHAFVQTAYREYFATELLWALACGCVGIVEYQAESSGHELIENYERSYRVTNPQQLADAISDAGTFDRQTVDDEWAVYDHEAILEQYLDLYAELQEQFGWL